MASSVQLLSSEESARLVTALRHGRSLEDATGDLWPDLLTVWATARTDTRLTVALAGRDPDAEAETARTAKAEYLRLLALGLPPTRAELIMGAGDVARRRAVPAYAKSCAAVSETTAPYGHGKWARLTPPTVARFLAKLRTPVLRCGATSVKAAAAAVGVTPQALSTAPP
ncbi:hypothetical protein [Streptomyces sp. NPDC050564]|uniref:hypothetical protein n=1 Tax=Streptomyces sp. NPDC050564 TaxID=3365631 RepID=UPI0037967BDB